MVAPTPQTEAPGRDVTVQMPLPPSPRAAREPGHARLDAQQYGERAIASDAIDATAVEVALDALGYETIRVAEAEVEKGIAHGHRVECDAAGRTLENDARHGRLTPTTPYAVTQGVVGLAEELADARQELGVEEHVHAEAMRVLAGETPYSDGATRPGSRLAPGAKHLGWATAGAIVLGVLPLMVPLIVEGVAVSLNMKSYLRSDDGDFLLPGVIAVSAVGILTLVPYLLGTNLNKVERGARLGIGRWIGLVAGGVVWLGVGIVLALIRVQVDRQEALRTAEAAYRDDVRLAQDLGQSAADVPAVDPAAVFDPVLPTVFWILVFVGLGVALILWEMTTYNPARLHELRTRRAVRKGRVVVAVLEEQESLVTDAASLQTQVNDLSLGMWDSELETIDAEAELDVRIYRHSLLEASGDPAMALALETHTRAIGAGSGQAAKR